MSERHDRAGSPPPDRPARLHPVLRHTLRALAACALTVLLLAALLLPVLRYMVLPHIDAFRPRIEALVSERLHVQFRIARLAPRWSGIRPGIEVTGLTIRDRRGVLALNVPHADVSISWRSIFMLEPILSGTIERPDLLVERDASGALYVAGVAVPSTHTGDATFSTWLLRQQAIVLRGGTLRWHDATRNAPDLALHELRLALLNDGTEHRFALQAPADGALLHGPLDFRAHFRHPFFSTAGKPENWHGDAYLATGPLDLRTLANYVKLPLTTYAGRIGNTIWASFAAGRITSANGVLDGTNIALRVRATQPRLDVPVAHFAWHVSAQPGDYTLKLTHFRAELAQPPLDGNAPDSASNDTPNSASNDTPGNAPGGTPGSAPGDISGNASNSTPNSAPNDTPGNAPGDTPGSVSGNIPGNASNNTPNSASNDTPGRAPGNIPGNASNSTPDSASNDTPGRTPGNTPGSASNGAPNGTLRTRTLAFAWLDARFRQQSVGQGQLFSVRGDLIDLGILAEFMRALPLPGRALDALVRFDPRGRVARYDLVFERAVPGTAAAEAARNRVEHAPRAQGACVGIVRTKAETGPGSSSDSSPGLPNARTDNRAGADLKAASGINPASAASASLNANPGATASANSNARATANANPGANPRATANASPSANPEATVASANSTTNPGATANANPSANPRATASANSGANPGTTTTSASPGANPRTTASASLDANPGATTSATPSTNPKATAVSANPNANPRATASANPSASPRATTTSATPAQPDWEPIVRYRLKADLQGISLAAQEPPPGLSSHNHPRAGLPGFENLWGRIDADETHGTLTLDAPHAAITLPGVFDNPRLTFDHLYGSGHWRIDAQPRPGEAYSAFRVTVPMLGLTNADMQATIEADYTNPGHGRGALDLHARIGRARLSQIPRYLPTSLTEALRHYLGHALQAGTVRHARIDVHGGLDKFPYSLAPQAGQFRVVAPFDGARFDPSPYPPRTLRDGAPNAWPALDGIRGQFALQENRLRLDIARAHYRDFVLTRVTGRIDDMGRRASNFVVTGHGQGPLADVLDYTNHSALADLSNHIGSTVRVAGPARLTLTLTIPRTPTPKIGVQGALGLAGDRLARIDAGGGDVGKGDAGRSGVGGSDANRSNADGIDVGGVDVGGINVGRGDAGGTDVGGGGAGKVDAGGANASGVGMGRSDVSRNNADKSDVGGVNMGKVDVGGINAGGVGSAGTGRSDAAGTPATSPLANLLSASNLVGTVYFTNRDAHFERLTGRFLGGDVSANGSLRDHRYALDVFGHIDANTARALDPQAHLAALPARMSGRAPYTLTVRGARDPHDPHDPRDASGPRRNVPDIALQSDLTGLALDLPAPFGKAASTPMPLHFTLQSETRADVRADAHSDVRAEAHAIALPDAHLDVRADTHSDVRAEAHAIVRPDAHLDVRADAHSDVRTEAHTIVRPDVHLDVRSNAHSDVRAEAHAIARPDAHLDVRADTHSDIRAEAHTIVRPDTRFDARPNTRTGNTGADSAGSANPPPARPDLRVPRDRPALHDRRDLRYASLNFGPLAARYVLRDAPGEPLNVVRGTISIGHAADGVTRNASNANHASNGATRNVTITGSVTRNAASRANPLPSADGASLRAESIDSIDATVDLDTLNADAWRDVVLQSRAASAANPQKTESAAHTAATSITDARTASPQASPQISPSTTPPANPLARYLPSRVTFRIGALTLFGRRWENFVVHASRGGHDNGDNDLDGNARGDNGNRNRHDSARDGNIDNNARNDNGSDRLNGNTHNDNNSIRLDGNTYSNNSSGRLDGNAYNGNGSDRLDDNTYSNNSRTRLNGNTYSSNSSGRLNGNAHSDNSSHRLDGNTHNDNGSTHLDGNTRSDNSRRHVAGNAYNDNGSNRLDDNTYSNNGIRLDSNTYSSNGSVHLDGNARSNNDSNHDRAPGDNGNNRPSASARNDSHIQPASAPTEWQANIASDQATGHLSWQPGESPNAPGALQARFARLAVPNAAAASASPGETAAATVRSLPALDLVVDQLIVHGHDLGRLQVNAHNVADDDNGNDSGSGNAHAGDSSARVWQLDRLDLQNPAAHLSASASWRVARHARLFADAPNGSQRATSESAGNGQSSETLADSRSENGGNENGAHDANRASAASNAGNAGNEAGANRANTASNASDEAETSLTNTANNAGNEAEANRANTASNAGDEAETSLTNTASNAGDEAKANLTNTASTAGDETESNHASATSNAGDEAEANRTNTANNETEATHANATSNTDNESIAGNATGITRANSKTIQHAENTAPDPAPQRTTLAFHLDIADAGALLERMGLPDTIEAGSGTLSGQASWQGSPLAPDYPTLDGTLALDVHRGQILKVHPGTAKLLALFSLQELAHVALLDFHDMRGQGLPFSRASGTAQIRAGTGQLRNVEMLTPPARVDVSGTVDLARQTQALRVHVTPRLDASTAVVAAAAINPLFGLGALAADLALSQSIGAAFAIDYTVTGSWHQPHVVRAARAARTARAAQTHDARSSDQP